MHGIHSLFYILLIQLGSIRCRSLSAVFLSIWRLCSGVRFQFTPACAGELYLYVRGLLLLRRLQAAQSSSYNHYLHPHCLVHDFFWYRTIPFF